MDAACGWGGSSFTSIACATSTGRPPRLALVLKEEWQPMTTFGTEFQLSSLDGTNGFQISGDPANKLTALSVAAAGDLNGDGFDDFIIGGGNVSPGGASY